ncbi:DUF4301 family protein [Spongiivirga citrea]|uniref:DUF4301 family protein n=1 Tax=Spongiivirga citrea TaxID=1481457 RepID=A0A6M0CGF9_9FLAO|nr:DUF4301 family protein [Spongiivirga citrea]NER16996.1 DUF4301 family protein [Spongiivirga citrea]
MLKLTDQDKQQLAEKGITEKELNRQIAIFKSEIMPLNIIAPATIENGISVLGEESENLVNVYEDSLNSITVVKFVPASGAATRMFKFLFEFIDNYNPKEQSINAYINRKKDTALRTYFAGLEKFPFYHKVLHYIEKINPDFQQLPADKFRLLFIETLIKVNGLNYGAFPKGLIPFHRYKNHQATPFQEHLFEAANYASVKEKANLHFTVSKGHLEKFKLKQMEIQDKIVEKTGVTFNCEYSFQQSYTDTVAVDMKNNPLRDEDGNLIFRPGGHGALIENLNTIDADVIFIKNIDNVVVQRYEEAVAFNKKVLAGKLLKLQQQIFQYAKLLEANPDVVDLEEVLQFIYSELNVQVSTEFEKYARKYQVEYLLDKLNRPIRVCGMVKNEGEPGGGPFWVKHESGIVSLQIVESAQVNKKDKEQTKLFKKSTHFNPVDLVCGVRDHHGNKYDLIKYVDKKTYFIASKSKNGKKLKALELPGLWNGAMANWNTVFVQVPLVTFNPVKTVNDLLKPPHQVKEE